MLALTQTTTRDPLHPMKPRHFHTRQLATWLAGFILTTGFIGDAHGAEAERLLPDGTFEADTDANQWPDGWGRPKTGGSWEQEDGNHFLRMTSSTPGETVMLYQQVRIPDTAKAIELKWRMRVSNLKKGKQSWFDAR